MDGLFHLALLQQLADAPAALATAKRMLQTEPDHVLALGVAAEASATLGDNAAAREYSQHLLQVYDVQFAKSLTEYDAHRSVMSQMKVAAEELVGR
jgi:hypothetical protein